MPPPAPPKAITVEVIAARPTEADRAAIAHLSARDRTSLPDMAHLVKIGFDTMPAATSAGWALYVGDFRIPKYWAHDHGIYFKVFDPAFFHDHQGQALRFSQNETDFIDTGLTLPASPPADPSLLPPQEQVLKR